MDLIGPKCFFCFLLNVAVFVRRQKLGAYRCVKNVVQNFGNLFRQLLNVSGIGGKLALSVLSALPVANFCAAVQSNDVKTLSRIPGIGKRTAERLVVELKDKVTSSGAASVFPSPGATAAATAVGDAALALEQLGFKRDAIDKVLKALTSELPASEQSSETLLRQAIIRLNF